jgi:penicillin-insensitive murein endopeptidase
VIGARLARLVAPVALGLASAGCFGTPTPLAPGVRGSIGLPHHGVLTDGAELPRRGPGYRLYRSNGIHYGHSRLVGAIQRAARRVDAERPGGAPLIVGDLSARRGGEASGHRSHRTGRDADLLIYSLTPDGRPVPTPGFVRFGPDGLGEAGDDFVRIDVEREWLLVRALVTDPDANVEWLFFACWLEALVIEHALARGEDPELVWQAESVLLQPRDSLPHDDHLHLRVACSPDDVVAGCVANGPRWPWLPAPFTLAPLADDELAHAIAPELLLTREGSSGGIAAP